MDPLITLIEEYWTAARLEDRLRAGDTLATAIRPRLHRYISHRIRRDLVEEALQRTLADIFKGLSNFNGTSDSEFRSWCLVIARRRMADLLRSKNYNNIELLGHEELAKIAEKSGEESAISVRERADISLILNLIETMEGPCKNYLRSHYVVGMDLAAMAKEYEMTPDAVRMAVNRCVKFIRTQLGE